MDLQLFAEEKEGKPEDKDKTPPANEDIDVNKKYIDEIKKLKETTVPKEKFEESEAQNKKLLEAVLNGGGFDQGKKENESPDITSLRDDLFGGKRELTNLEFCKKTLELRKAIMDEGGIDPFVPVGSQIDTTDEDIKTAERVANILQWCIDTCENDSHVLTSLLQSKMKEGLPQFSRAKA